MEIIEIFGHEVELKIEQDFDFDYLKKFIIMKKKERNIFKHFLIGFEIGSIINPLRFNL